MTVGTLGAGEVAQAFAIHLLKAGHEVLFSNSRGPSSLTQLVSKLGKGAREVTMVEAAKAPIVVLAVPWPKVEEVLGKLPDWEGRILIDATNHFLLPSMELADLKGRVSSEIVSELAPSAKVVKARGNALKFLYITGSSQDFLEEYRVQRSGLAFARDALFAGITLEQA
jgi:8-hydroxy-5-deazaflavin:NADPH oxidoreductase